jgi:hypothetical protein
MTYIVDLTTVLKLLFDITLIRVPQSSGRTTWSELKGAFEQYEGAGSRQRIHHRICAIFQQDQQILDPDSFHRIFHELVKDGPDAGGPSSPVSVSSPVAIPRPQPVKRKSTKMATPSPAPVATSNTAPVTTSSSARVAAPEPTTGSSRRRRARFPCICQ